MVNHLKVSKRTGETIDIEESEANIYDSTAYARRSILVNATGTATLLATEANQTNKAQYVRLTDGTDDVDVITNTDDSTNIDGVNGLVGSSILYARIDGDKIKPLRMDASTHSIQTLEYEHHEIHSGSSFVCVDLRNVDSTTFKWQVTTPAGTKYAHMVFDIDCTGEMTVLITEGSDRVDGTALVELNRNRVGTPNVAGTILTHTPTGGSTDGTVVLVNHRSGATGQGSKTVSGGGLRGGNEFVLKPATKYVISVTTYADVWVTLDLDWYEHTDKD